MKIVMFTQSFCQPCKQLKPHVQAASKLADLPFEDWDVENNWDLAIKYEVMSTPTVFLMTSDNEVLKQLHGKSAMAIKAEL